MGKNIAKNRSKSLSGKCCQKLIDHAKQSTTDAFKSVSKKKTAKVSITSSQKNLDTVEKRKHWT